MDVEINRRLAGELRNSSHIEGLLRQVGALFAARLIGVTPVETGATVASTRVEGGHRSADGRSRAVRVVQSGAAVPQQFGNARERTPARQFDRARGSL